MSHTRSRLTKLGLVAGYLALVGAVLLAHSRPATGYELSIYRETPALVWAGLLAALSLGTVSLFTADREERAYAAAALLVVSTVVAFLALPVIRGYFFYGAGDSLSHVGWSREIATGALEPRNLLYPGIHTMTVFVSSLAGVPLTLANLYVVLVGFPLVFLLALPLAVQVVASTRHAFAVGLVAAALFTPINNIAIHVIAHPSSQAVLFLPFVLFLAFAYLLRGRTGAGWRSWVPRPGSVTGIGLLLALALVAILFIHPQQALNLTFCLVAITGLQALARWWSDDAAAYRHRLLHVPTAVIAAAFLLWAPRFERVQGAVISTIQSIVTQGASAGDVVASKSVSINTLGGSVPVLFTKLFLAGVIVSAVAAVVILFAVTNRFQDHEANEITRYVAAALVPVSAIFLVVLASGAGDMYFRYQGFIMVPVTILGAAGLALALDSLGTSRSRRVGAVLAVALLLVLLPASLVTIHTSPYIYQPTPHVAEAQANGYASAFEHREDQVAFTGLRGGPRRYVDYHYGTEQARETLEFPGYQTGTPPDVFVNANYSDYFEDPHYLTITRPTHRIEIGLYDGFRYPERGFRALETTPGVNRVQSSDGFHLYRVGTSGTVSDDGDEQSPAPPENDTATDDTPTTTTGTTSDPTGDTTTTGPTTTRTTTSTPDTTTATETATPTTRTPTETTTTSDPTTTTETTTSTPTATPTPTTTETTTTAESTTTETTATTENEATGNATGTTEATVTTMATTTGTVETTPETTTTGTTTTGMTTTGTTTTMTTTEGGVERVRGVVEAA